MKWGLIIAIVAAALAGAYWLLGRNGVDADAIRAQVRADMVSIPGGDLRPLAPVDLVQVSPGDWALSPQTPVVATDDGAPVTVAGFAMMAHEPQAALRDAFSQATGTTLDSFAFTYAQAEAFCTWLDMRLPTEVEWEFAARSGGTLTVWATDDGTWDEGRNAPGPDSLDDTQWPANPAGLVNMHVGAYEWVASDDLGDIRIAKGGSDNSSAMFEIIPGRFEVNLQTAPAPGLDDDLPAEAFPRFPPVAVPRCVTDE